MWCFVHFDLEICFAPQRRALFRHLNFQKSSDAEGCFAHFDLEMCFAPQRRALFRHLNFQKWSGPGVSCTFWLGNVLRATTACTFSTSQLPKVVRSWGVLYLLTWKCASRHNGVQFFISHLASWLRTRRFSEPTFRPSGAPNHWKNTMFRDFPTFSRICIFFLLTLSLSFSSTLLSSNLSLLSASSLLCFSSVHIVGNLTFKLPSTRKELACAVRQPGLCVLCAKLLQCCCPRTWPARVPGAMQRHASTFLTHHIAPFTLHIWALFIWFMSFPYVSYVLLGYYFHVIWAQLKLSHALDLLSTYLGASARQQGWA